MFLEKQRTPEVGVAFFYFTFSDEAKRNQSAMIRAWILQL
jgi:hypothetical protein